MGRDWDEEQIWEVGHNHQNANTNTKADTNTKLANYQITNTMQ